MCIIRPVIELLLLLFQTRVRVFYRGFQTRENFYCFRVFGKSR